MPSVTARVRPLLRRLGSRERGPASVAPLDDFHSRHYLRHTQRRQEHLASLGLPLAGRSVLEVGAGTGDHTSFFLDRNCSVVTTEPRPANLALLRRRYPHLDVKELDLDTPDTGFDSTAEIVYCYGTLHHLARPAEALAFLADRCTSMLLLETCVSPGTHEALNPVDEPSHITLAGGVGPGVPADPALGPTAPR